MPYLVTAIPTGAEVDGIAGNAGWAGAGLLSAVLGWFFLRHLPNQARLLRDLIDVHLAALAARDKALETLSANHLAVVERILEHDRTQAREAREAVERRYARVTETLDKIQLAVAQAGFLTQQLAPLAAPPVKRARPGGNPPPGPGA